MNSAKMTADQSFKAIVLGSTTKTHRDGSAKDKQLKKLRALKLMLTPKVKPKKTLEERAILREQLQKYVCVSKFLFCFPLRFGTIAIGLLDSLASGAICAAYIYMATGMFDGSTMDTFEEIGFHIRTCSMNASLAMYTSDRLKQTYLMLSIQRYVMISFLLIIIGALGISGVIALVMHEGTKTNDKLCVRAWIYVTFMRIPFCLPTGMALICGCQAIANAFTHEVNKMQQEFLRVSGKEYRFHQAKTRELRNELLINGSGLFAYGLVNLYFLFVVAAFYINMDEIIYKKMTKLTKRPIKNPFTEESYTPAPVIMKTPTAERPKDPKKSEHGNKGEEEEGTGDASDDVRVKTKEQYLEEAAKTMKEDDGQMDGGDNLSVLSLSYATRPPAATKKQDLEIPGEGDEPQKETKSAAVVVHSIHTDERFMDPDGGGRMIIYTPIGRHGENREGFHLRRRNRAGNQINFGRKKVASANDVVADQLLAGTAWGPNDGFEDIDGLHQRRQKGYAFEDNPDEFSRNELHQL